MVDYFSIGIYITVGAAVIALFLRIENRITRVETSIDFIKANCVKCQLR